MGSLMLSIGLIFLWGCELRSPGSPLVGVIIWDREIQTFAENCQGVWEGLREEGFREGLNLTVRVVNAAADRGLAAQAAQDLQVQGAQMLITLGTVPTLVALEATPDSHMPIIYSHVSSLEATGLAWGTNPEGTRFTGTSSEVSAQEQLHFFQLALPKARRLGILYCTATPVAVATGAALEGAAREGGLTAFSAPIPDDRLELMQNAFRELLHDGMEALFLPDDPVLLKPRNLQWLCQQATQALVPVIGPSRFSTEYGVFMAYHGDLFEIGRQTGRQAARLLRGERLGAVAPERPRVKRLSVNLKAGQNLNLTLSRNFLSRAYYLIQ
jgi:putative ABC transport system substrate-binding protein